MMMPVTTPMPKETAKILHPEIRNAKPASPCQVKKCKPSSTAMNDAKPDRECRQQECAIRSPRPTEASTGRWDRVAKQYPQTSATTGRAATSLRPAPQASCDVATTSSSDGRPCSRRPSTRAVEPKVFGAYPAAGSPDYASQRSLHHRPAFQFTRRSLFGAHRWQRTRHPQLLEDVGWAIGAKLSTEFDPQAESGRDLTADTPLQEKRAVHPGDKPGELQLPIGKDLRTGADRRPAGSIQLGEQRPFRRREDPAFPNPQMRTTAPLKRDITRADGYANHPLSSRGNHYFGCERKDRGACRTQQAQSAQSRHRQKGCGDIALYKLAKPGLNISTKQLDAKIGPSMQKLSPASGGVRSTTALRGQKTVSISGLYLLHGPQITRASRGSSRRRMPPSVIPVGNLVSRSFRLCTPKSTRPSIRASCISFGKKAFAADICQAAVLYPITRRTDDCLGYEQ